MNNFISRLLTFEEIISENFFVIPDYQRGYSWEDAQLADFKADIIKVAKKDYSHYTGTIVLTPANDGNNVYEIVDGQQRITTIIILLNCIYQKNSTKYISLYEKYIQRGGIGKERPVLLTNEETKSFFHDTIIGNKEKTAEIKSHECIFGAKKFFNEWLNDKKTDVDEILNTVLKKLGFLCYAPNNTKDIGIMFEVINNRGKELSELEKIKNYFIYLTSVYGRDSLREEINSRWGNIQIYLSKAGVTNNDAENRFLRNCYIVFYDSSKAESWNVYANLKELHPSGETVMLKIDGHIKRITAFVEFLEVSALHYAYLLNQHHFNVHYAGHRKADISNWLKRLRCQPSKASVLPLYLALMTYLDSPDVVVEFLEWIEKVNFRLYVLNKITGRADTEQGNLFWFAHSLYWDKNKGWDTTQSVDYYDNHTVKTGKIIDGNHLDWVKANLRDLVEYYCPEKKFVQALTLDKDEKDDFYRWRGIRYFLASFEEHLQESFKTRFDIEEILVRKDDEDSMLNDVLSLEHIWASKNLQQYFEPNHHEKRRLGNFVLMGLAKNIELQNGLIEEKVNELINNQSSLIKLRQVTALEDHLKKAVKYLNEDRKLRNKTHEYYRKISMRMNDKREMEMIDFALKRWALPGEKVENFRKVDSFEAEDTRMNETYFFKK